MTSKRLISSLLLRQEKLTYCYLKHSRLPLTKREKHFSTSHQIWTINQCSALKSKTSCISNQNSVKLYCHTVVGPQNTDNSLSAVATDLTDDLHDSENDNKKEPTITDKDDNNDYEDDDFLSELREGALIYQGRDRQLDRKDYEKVEKPESIIRKLLSKKKSDVPKIPKGKKIDTGWAVRNEDVSNYVPKVYEIEKHLFGHIQKVVIPKLYSLAPLVNESETLRNLVYLGVDLHKITQKGMADHVLKMDFNKDVQPLLWFFKDTGIPAESFGSIITRFPYIFKQDVDNLKVRVDYLRSKKFSQDTIVHMIDTVPEILCLTTIDLDSKLGFYQKEIRLSGNQLRTAVLNYPRMLLLKKSQVKTVQFYMENTLGFTDQELKKIVIGNARVFRFEADRLESVHDYLTKVMGISNAMIARWPPIFHKYKLEIEERHRFLLRCGRAQYDPLKENYVSLEALMSTDDNEWSVDVAKSSFAEFNMFLRTI